MFDKNEGKKTHIRWLVARYERGGLTSVRTASDKWTVLSECKTEDAAVVEACRLSESNVSPHYVLRVTHIAEPQQSVVVTSTRLDD